jgi:hypothetical protein
LSHCFPDAAKSRIFKQPVGIVLPARQTAPGFTHKSGKAVQTSGATSGAVELQSEQEKIPQETEIVLVTMPTVVAFAANQSTHENRSADSLHGVIACRAFRHATLFIGRRFGGHRVPPGRIQILDAAASISARANSAHWGNPPSAGIASALLSF